MNNIAKMSVALCLSVLPVSRGAPAGSDQSVTQVEEIRIHVANGGVGWVQVSSLVWNVSSDASAWDDFDPDDYDVLAEYGLKNRKTKVENVGNRRKRVVTRARLTDIIQVVRILDSSHPFRLCRHNTFNITWNGNVFRLQMEYQRADEAKRAPKKPPPPSIGIQPIPATVEITTDGRFTDNSTGRLSENRSRISIKLADNALLLEIEDLGID